MASSNLLDYIRLFNHFFKETQKLQKVSLQMQGKADVAEDTECILGHRMETTLLHHGSLCPITPRISCEATVRLLSSRKSSPLESWS